MSASPAIKEELPDADESDLLCFDDIDDIIRRAENIIQEHREMNRRSQIQTPEAAREQALAILREPLPFLESEETDTNAAALILAACEEQIRIPSPSTFRESEETDTNATALILAALEEEIRIPSPITDNAQPQPIMEPISQGSAAATVDDDDDDDVIFIDEAPHVVIDLSTPNPRRKRRQRSNLNNLQNVVITIDSSFEANSTLTSPVVNLAPFPVTFSQTTPDIESNTSNSRLPGINCPICLDSCQKPTSTLCGHIFCEKCIKAAIQSTHKCPLCKRKLSPKAIHPVFL